MTPASRGSRSPRLSYANVMVTLLALVVLGGGVAYAAGKLPKNSVGPKQLRKNSVTGAKVKDGSLKEVDFAKGQLPAGPQGAPGVPGTSHGFEATGSVNYDKFSASLFGSQVVSLPVPAGSYLAIATVEAETVNGVASTVQCRLIDGNGGAESTWATTRSQPVRVDGFTDNFTLAAIFDVTKGQALNLQCSKDNAGSSARITEANIVAVEISDVAHDVH